MKSYKAFEQFTNEVLDEINHRIENEKNEAKEKDLSQFDFKNCNIKERKNNFE